MAKQNDDRPKLGDLMKTIPRQETPIQEVRPVVQKVQEEQVKISGFWASADLYRRLKVTAATEGKKDRQVIVDALEAYLNK